MAPSITKTRSRRTVAKSRAACKVREPRPGEYGWIIQRHGEIYAAEYGWDMPGDARFEGLVANVVAEFLRKHDPARERCWIADIGGKPAGCIMLVRKTAATAKLRILLVDPAARGHGVGSLLVSTCVEFARAAGYKRIELWTNPALTTAAKLYITAGFRRVRIEPHQLYGTGQIGEFWELRLTTRG